MTENSRGSEDIHVNSLGVLVGTVFGCMRSPKSTRAKHAPLDRLVECIVNKFYYRSDFKTSSLLYCREEQRNHYRYQVFFDSLTQCRPRRDGKFDLFR